MATGSNFPTSLDSFTDKINGVDDILSVETNTQSSALEALEAKVGVDNSGVATSHDYKISTLEDILDASAALDGWVLMVDSGEPNNLKFAANPAGFPDPTTTRGDLIYRNASTTTRLPVGSAGQVLTSDGTDPVWAADPSSLIGHFRTNFSIDQKEDTEGTEFDVQQMFQQIAFGTIFDSVTEAETFLHSIDTVLVPADSHEAIYTGTWLDFDVASFKFGRARRSVTAGDTVYLDFTGVSCGIGLSWDNINGAIKAELSRDGGSTWEQPLIFTGKQTSATGTYGKVCSLYSGLPFGDYRLRLTVIEPTSTQGFVLEYFYYTTYMNQRPITQWADTAGGAASVADVPPTTSLLTGTWIYKNRQRIEGWNNTYQITVADGAYLEFKFFGSACWVNVEWAPEDITIGILIDGSTAKVKTTPFSIETPSNTSSAWVRLDDGTLAEGWHTVRITRTTGATGSDYLGIYGVGYYSGDQSIDTTVKRSLICGKESYLVGVDDAGFAFTGTWNGNTDNSESLLKRQNYTDTQNDYVTITTPNNANLKAIYLVTKTFNTTAEGERKISLGGASSNLRYLNGAADNYEQDCLVQLLYDKVADGVDLHNKELRIVNNTAARLTIEGVIFEIGNTTETDYIKCMPKWTRYNDSTNPKPPVSTSHRLDVYGAKTDKRDGRRPMVHSGWINGTEPYWRHGLGVSVNELGFDCGWNYDGVPHNGNLLHPASGGLRMNSNGDPGAARIDDAASHWWKAFLYPARPI